MAEIGAGPTAGTFRERKGKGRSNEADSDALCEEIGRLNVELDWLKKKSGGSIEQMRPLVELDHPEISIRRQCELLGVSRLGLYYEPVGDSAESPRDYLKDCASVEEARTGIAGYFRFYNHERLQFNAFGPERLFYTGDTGTEDRAPQGCDPSADSSAEWRGGFTRRPKSGQLP